jgi:AcrR family transcriptional regulator
MELQVKIEGLADRILEDSFYLFRQYGFRAITMDDIASHMGMSKKTIYAHFADKDELVTTAIEKRIITVRLECEKIREHANDAVEEMILCMRYLDGLFRNMNPVFLPEMNKFHVSAFRFFQKHKDEYLIQMIRTNLETGIAQDLYRPVIDLDILSVYRMESSMMCFRPDLFPRDLYEMGKVHLELMEHFLYGVATPKGYKLIEKYKKKYLQNL